MESRFTASILQQSNKINRYSFYKLIKRIFLTLKIKVKKLLIAIANQLLIAVANHIYS